jgi:phospholipid transport system transporter-binding protein
MGSARSEPGVVLSTDGAGCWVLTGDLSLVTVSAVWQRREELLGALPGASRAEPLVVDLGGVSRTDSAGLALLIGLLREARKRDLRLQFATIPEQLRSLAQLSGVSVLLGLDADPPPATASSAGSPPPSTGESQ